VGLEHPNYQLQPFRERGQTVSSALFGLASGLERSVGDAVDKVHLDLKSSRSTFEK